MKKVLLSLTILSLFFAHRAEAAIVLVQVATSSNAGVATTSLGVDKKTWTAGNTIIVICLGSETTSASSTIKDGGGANSVNTYVSDAKGIATSDSFTILRSSNITGGARSIYCNTTSTRSFGNMFVAEYSGLANSSPIDTSSTAAGTNTSPNPGNITTGNANDLIFSSFVDGNAAANTITAGGGCTLRAYQSNGVNIQVAGLADRITTTKGTYDCSFTANDTGTHDWRAAQVSYKAAAASPAQNSCVRVIGRKVTVKGRKVTVKGRNP